MKYFKLTRPSGEAKLYTPGSNYIVLNPVKLIPSDKSDYDVEVLAETKKGDERVIATIISVVNEKTIKYNKLFEYPSEARDYLAGTMTEFLSKDSESQTYYSPTTKYNYKDKSKFINDIYLQPTNTILMTTRNMMNIYSTEIFVVIIP